MSRSFAIAIPVYNGAAHLRLALASAITQTRAADEIVALDDASTDETAAILREHAGSGVTVHRLDDRRPAPQAWNEAVRQTSSQFVVVLAHDDLLHANFLEEAERAIISFPQTDLFIAQHELIDGVGAHRIVRQGKRSGFGAAGPISNRDFLDRFTRVGQFFLPSATVFGRALFDRLGGFDPHIRVAYDWDFFLRAGAAANVYIDDRALVSYRIHSQQSIAAHTREDNGDSDAIFRKLPELGMSLSEKQKRWLVENMCDFLRRFATWPLTDEGVAPSRVIENRDRIARKLEDWKRSSNPYAKYVRAVPRHWRQWIVWNFSRRPSGIRLARTVLKAARRIPAAGA